MKLNRLKPALLAGFCSTVLTIAPGITLAAAAAAPAPTAQCVGPDCLKTNVRKSKDQIVPGDRGARQQVKPVGEAGGVKQVPVEAAPAEHR